MKSIYFKEDKIPCIEMIKRLYEDAGWVSYTKDIQRLEKAFEKSTKVISAWNQEECVGIIRALSDGVSIMYIQDILVHSAYQRKGIGQQLITQMMNCYSEVRQTVLITDHKEKTISFYEKMGLKQLSDYHLVGFIQIK